MTSRDDACGVIINIASLSGFRAPGPGLAHYVAAKHAVVGLTKALAIEPGERNIRVVAIAPAVVESDKASPEELEELERRCVAADITPLGRAAIAGDIARVAVFAASDAAIYLTGITIPVDGGRSVGNSQRARQRAAGVPDSHGDGRRNTRDRGDPPSTRTASAGPPALALRPAHRYDEQNLTMRT
jgi:hypothetical protein